MLYIYFEEIFQRLYMPFVYLNVQIHRKKENSNFQKRCKKRLKTQRSISPIPFKKNILTAVQSRWEISLTLRFSRQRYPTSVSSLGGGNSRRLEVWRIIRALETASPRHDVPAAYGHAIRISGTMLYSSVIDIQL